MSIKLRPMLAFKRVVLFGRALFALRKLPNGDEVSWWQLWVFIGRVVEYPSSSR